MTEAFPLLVGITGKLDFDPDPSEHDRLAERVRGRLARIFGELSKRYPHSPKVLLTGAARGADLIAAEAALEAGLDWSVAVVLPYDEALFEKDFRVPGAKAPGADGTGATVPALGIFRALLAKAQPGQDQRVLLQVMPPLRTAPGGAPVGPEQLDKDHPAHDKILRRQHYEQVGQFIAETAMVLIAVMDPEARVDTQAANGGTARVVACRRAGRPDGVGTEVALRSDILRNRWSEVMMPPGGFVWLIDPHARDSRHAFPFTVLPPLTDRDVSAVYGGHPGRDMPRRASRKWAAQRRALRGSLRLARAFEHFEIRRLRLPHGKSTAPGKPSPRAALHIQMPPHAHLRLIRSVISDIQPVEKGLAERAFHWIARLFIVAVLALEIFNELLHDNRYMLSIYVLALFAVGAVVITGELKLWQIRAEDYRALSEMLRVQRVWWAAGLTERVDRFHLQGADTELSRIRDAARAILGWVSFRAGWQVARQIDWAVVRDGGDDPGKPRSTKKLALPRGAGKQPSDWIGGQIGFYASRLEQREERTSFRDCATWLLFATSIVLGLILAVVLWAPPLKTLTDKLVDAVAIGDHREIATLLGAAGFASMTWLRLRLHDIRSPIGAWTLTGVASLVAACCVWIATTGLGEPLAWVVNHLATKEHADHPVEAAEAMRRLTVVFVVLLTALAGAIRFLTEKLGLEAEALTYRDALDKFERAERFLASKTDPVTRAPTDPQVWQALVLELGILALQENEAWLQAHRERPLGPIVG